MTRFTTITLVLKTAHLKIADELGLVDALEALWDREDPLVPLGCATGIERLEEARVSLDEAIYQLRRLREDFRVEQEVK